MIKKLSIWLLISIIFISTINFFKQKHLIIKENYINFITDIKNRKIKEIKLNKKKIEVTQKNNYKYTTYLPIYDPYLLKKIIKNKIKIFIKPNKKTNILLSIIISWLPTLLLITLWYLFIKQIQSNNEKGTFFFGKNKSKILNKKKNRIKFKDVAGCDEAKEEVKQLVDYLKEPLKFQKLGGKIPKGILMIGPPGTGKTLLAKAIAGEAKVPFFSISGSDFVEIFVGIGASRVRNLFNEAKKSSPCIIFIDEIDAVGKKRSIGFAGSNDEREQTLNQMLVEMDGFESKQNIIVIAATNRPDILDPALLRPGRFDRQVNVDLPDIKGRIQIIKIHTKNIPLNKNVNISILARSTPGFSGADLANLINEATLFAAKNNSKSISMKDFEIAKDKIILGTERKSLVMTKKQKEITAFHESGHTIVGILSPEQDPIHKVTIIPRGRALGITFFLPENDNVCISKKKLESKIATLYGGRIAEELIYGKENISTGAANDIKIATSIARKMVTIWGFSEKAGPLLYSYKENNLLNKQKNISEHTYEIIDQEIKNIINKNYKYAKKILKENIDILYKMKKKLIKYETLNSKEINNIIYKKK